MPALTACPEGNEPWSTENSGPNSVFAMSSAGRGRSTRFFVSCETTMLPASSAVRKNSADRQRRITNSHAGMSRIVSTAPGISPRYWKAIGTTQLTWSSPLAPTSRRHASSSGWVNGAVDVLEHREAEGREQREPDEPGDEQCQGPTRPRRVRCGAGCRAAAGCGRRGRRGGRRARGIRHHFTALIGQTAKAPRSESTMPTGNSAA